MSIFLTGKNIIGNTLSSEGTTTFQGEDPGTGTKISPLFYEASPGEISQAIEKAAKAFQEYRNKSGPEKASFLETIADELMAAGDDLIHRCMQETGLTESRLTGERGRTVSQLRLFASVLREGSWVDARIDTPDPERKPLEKPDIRSMLQALGPVGIFGASNFPLAFSVAGGDTASALAAGCPVIFKAHPSHPGTCELVGLAIQRSVTKSAMPEGTFSMVHGQSTTVGLAIVRHPLVKAIGFTGSYRGGKALFDEAVKRDVPIPVYAEMGSSNPVFVLPEAMKEKAENIAKDLANSVALGTGQFCTNPGLVLLMESAESKTFKEALSMNFSALPSGVMLNSGIQENYLRGIEKLSTSIGVNVMAKGNEEGNGCRATAYILETTASQFLEDSTLEEEIFGPATLTISAPDKHDLYRIAEKLTGHLTATIHGTDNDLQEYAGLIRILEQKVGRILINGYPTGVEVCHAMVHGGPFPATTDSRSTSVGTLAIKRFSRHVCYQNFPDLLLPVELRSDNPLGILRLANGEYSREKS